LQQLTGQKEWRATGTSRERKEDGGERYSASGVIGVIVS